MYPACRTTSLQRSRNSSSVRSLFARFASAQTIWRFSMVLLPPRATGRIWSYSYSCGLFQDSGLPVSAHWKWSPYFACISLCVNLASFWNLYALSEIALDTCLWVSMGLGLSFACVRTMGFWKCDVRFTCRYVL